MTIPEIKNCLVEIRALRKATLTATHLSREERADTLRKLGDLEAKAEGILCVSVLPLSAKGRSPRQPVDLAEIFNAEWKG